MSGAAKAVSLLAGHAGHGDPAANRLARVPIEPV